MKIVGLGPFPDVFSFLSLSITNVDFCKAYLKVISLPFVCCSSFKLVMIETMPLQCPGFILMVEMFLLILKGSYRWSVTQS